MKKRILLVIITFLSLGALAAKTPTDEQLKALCRDAGFALQSAATTEAKQQAFDALATKLAQQTDLQKISAQQVDMVFDLGGVTLQPYLAQWLAPTLETKATREGGIFSFLQWKYMPRKDMFHVDAQELASLKRFLDDRQLGKVLEQQPEVARDIINGLSSLKYANWSTEGIVQSVCTFLGSKLSDAAVMESVKVFNSAMMADSLGHEAHEQLRLAVLAQYQQLQQTATTPRIQKNCQEQITYLEGPFAKGTLVGSQAPELHFLRYYGWQGDSVQTKDIQTLGQLYAQGRGPVVMLDFWGTKCVPCLQAIPELADIQRHFQGQDVCLIGVTSLQGYFVDTPNHRTIQCRNNPEKELGLFPDFMKAMGINWNLGISEEEVMNTDYGVLAIPHIVLIDRQGRVRYNALSAEKEDKIALIETLLQE